MTASQLDHSPSLKQSLARAFALARHCQDEYLTGEHLLHGLLEDPSVAGLFARCGVEREPFKSRLTEEMARTFGPSRGTLRAAGIEPTSVVRDALALAPQFAAQAGKPNVEGVHALLGLTRAEESLAVFLLDEVGLTALRIKQLVAADQPAPAPAAVEGVVPASQPDPLEEFAVNLNRRAMEGRLDALIGRDREIQRTIQTLCRRRKNNPLLVGDPGVGKTAIAEGLAWRIVQGTVPAPLANAVVYTLNLGSLVAGAKYRGDFEKRLKGLLEHLERRPEVVLFIDEIHTLIGAGSATGGTMDGANLLKPALASGQLRLIGATTFRECRQIFERDQALARRFQKIDVHEPSLQETRAILEGLRPALEKHHGVTYSTDALDAAVALSVRHFSDRLLPDKAIDLLDEAGAHQRLAPVSDALAAQPRRVDRSSVERAVAELARIPPEQVSVSDREALGTLANRLEAEVFGQSPAIHSLVDAIKISRAGLRDPNRPVGSFLFAGPTGVGKTEITARLAIELGIKLVHFDMSEYMEAHSVARLLGAPPGYVGHGQGGLLTEAIVKDPHCVLLLDEIEKAHPDVFNVLLQVMDRGVLTDATGRSADFRNVVLVMTTNAGAQQAARPTMGFTHQDRTSEVDTALKSLFAPEFRNRLDRIVRFNALGRDDIRRVVRKEVGSLEVMLAGRGVTLSFSEGALEWLAMHGFDQALGARPLARTVEQHLKQPLADALLFGALSKGGHARVDTADEALTVECTDVPAIAV